MFENWPNENSIITDPMLNYFIFVAVIAFPLYKIIKRVGLNPAYLLSALIPFVGWLITIAFIGHKAWPIMNDMTQERDA